jgi:hypothetical protein
MSSFISIIFNKFSLDELIKMCNKGVELEINDGEIVGFNKTNIPTEPAISK